MVEAQSADLKCISSSEVTDEVKILDDYEVLPLKEDVWVKSINTYIQNSRPREENIDLIRKSGFDIQSQIRDLEELYYN